ncbi:MAG: DUF1801 domain-containing protein [Acidobacteriota bacterium]
MQSKATTVRAYLQELPPDRRAAIEAVRQVILHNLDKDFEEGISYGMIGYYVPHRVFPAGYHCDPRQPLCFAGLASQKNYMSLYLMSVYGRQEEQERFVQEWAKTGKKLDMGKACVRFKRLEDLPLDVIGRAIHRVSAKAYVEHYVKSLAARGRPVETTKRASKTTKASPAKKKTAAAKKAKTKKSTKTTSTRKK